MGMLLGGCVLSKIRFRSGLPFAWDKKVRATSLVLRGGA